MKRKKKNDEIGNRNTGKREKLRNKETEKET
jgi:hypothetical protein